MIKRLADQGDWSDILEAFLGSDLWYALQKYTDLSLNPRSLSHLGKSLNFSVRPQL